MNFSVSRVGWEQASLLLKNVREQVFICEWRIPEKIEFDQHDKHAFHMLVCDDQTQEAIATGRILPSGEISRIAVLKPYRKHRVDKVVVKGLLSVAREIGLNQVFVSSPLSKVEHYRGHNFNIAGSVYMEAGIARQKLVCPIDNFHDRYKKVKGYLSH